MVFDPSDDESADHEPDPEAQFRDPDHDSLTIPSIEPPDSKPETDDEPYADSVRIPTVTTDELDAPEDLLEAFWVVVLVINGAILAASLGALYIIFEGNTNRGGLLLAIGLVLGGFAARRYREYERVAAESTGTTDADETDDAN
ncbi:DUF7322 domain-containing protein [Natrinema marinum]|uniref:DUF7322 domain-containing protein n=1 Tax=Natrinema marinum TaxID=2961598 RepID=UPI0020C916E4|nr:hypothetical protein [Natrinema marinum]